MKTSFLAAAAAAALAAPAFAQQPAPPTGTSPFPVTRAAAEQQIQGRFGTRDANHDGFLDNAELGPDAAQALAALDGDRDGKVSLAEVTRRMIADFDRVDADHDGSVTEAEAMAAGPPPQAQGQPQPN